MTYILISLLGLCSGVLASYIAATRSVKQPVSFNKDCEREFIALLLNNPSMFLKVKELQPNDFAFKEYGEFFDKIQKRMYLLNFNYDEVSPSNIDSKLDDFRTTIETDVAFKNDFNKIVTDISQESIEISEKLDMTKTLPDCEETILNNGMGILDASYDRTLYNGNSKIVKSTENPDIPLIRQYRKPSPARVLASGLYGALSLALSFVLSQNSPFTGQAQIFVFLGFGLLAFFTLLWALVDIDTMYLDMYSFRIGFIVIAVTALAAGIAAGKLSLLLPGVAIALGGAIIFEIANFLYKMLRGRDGIGAGDTLILLASAGAPAALLSSWVVGYYSVLFAFILGLLGWVTLFGLGRVSRSTPFAFGPYLAFGWVFATSFYLYTQGFTV